MPVATEQSETGNQEGVTEPQPARMPWLYVLLIRPGTQRWGDT